MGNTCASVHILWSRPAELAAKAISRSYSKLGYARVKKSPAEGGKHVALLARSGERYVSVYDSNNAQLDSGELKDVAAAASKALKTAAVFTSLYDSDSYEFIVFANGRQIDVLMSEDEDYEGPMKRLSAKSRAEKWSGLFRRTLTHEQIQEAAAPRTPFADNILAGLSKLIGLSDGQPSINYQDFLHHEEKPTAELFFKRAPKAAVEIPPGKIQFTDYFDPDNCRMRSVYPASWPIPVASKRLATWLILSEGAGFQGGTATVRVTGPDTFVPAKAIISGCKFHNGQIVGSLENLPKGMTQEDVAKLVDEKRFVLTSVENSPGTYSGEFPKLVIPSVTPERTTQILLILQMDLEPQAAGEWEIDVSLQPGGRTEYRHTLPPLRITAIEQRWLPVVSGLNLKTAYDKSNLSANHLRELEYKQTQVPALRRLDHPAVTSSVIILRDREKEESQKTLNACKTWLEEWLRPLAEHHNGEIKILAEKQMTESAYVGKTKKTLPASNFLADKIWDKLFHAESNYQTVLVSFFPKNAECAIAGIGLQQSFGERGRDRRNPGYQLSNTLSTMRGRPIEDSERSETWHVFKWVVNHTDGYQFLATSAEDMERQLDKFARERTPLQAWSGQCTWIPLFDQAGDYELTAYEEISVLNWFRGILNNDGGLHTEKMTAQWCSNVLRMVAPTMWVCGNLMDQVDRAKLEQVAEVTEAGGTFKIALKPECSMEQLELALLPILPVESARISLA